MIFNPIGSIELVTGYLRGAVTVMEIMFEAAIIVETNVIGVVTTQTLSVARRFADSMTFRLALYKFHVTCSAAGASGSEGIVVSL